jgi:hypothetical protein
MIDKMAGIVLIEYSIDYSKLNESLNFLGIIFKSQIGKTCKLREKI